MVTSELSNVTDMLRCGRSTCSCARSKGPFHCPAHDDAHPSLSVTLTGNKILYRCHAGCSQVAVIDALKNRNVIAPTKSNGTAKKFFIPRGEPIAIYDYTTEDGTLVFQVVKFPNTPDGKKDFRQRKPGKTGGWNWSTQDIEKVPYNLPQVAKARAANRKIVLCEGEQCVETLRAHGIVASCNAGGAKKWVDSYNKYFIGADVLILPDNDGVGEDHALIVAKALQSKAKSIKIIRLPGLPPKGDIVDWIRDGHTIKELVAIEKQTPEWTLQPEDIDFDFRPSESGSADRILTRHGKNIRHAYNENIWYSWMGNRWKDRSEAIILNHIEEEIRDMYDRASQSEGSRAAKELAKYAIKCESNGYMKSVLSILRRRSPISVIPLDFNANPYLLNCHNGTVELLTGKLRDFNKDDLITKIAGSSYDPDAKCPIWEEFLQRIQPDIEVRGFLQRASGYALTGDTGEQCMFFMFGNGSNGKSVYLSTIMSVMDEYAMQSMPDLLLTKRNERIPVEIAELEGKRLVATTEIDQGRKLAEATVKQLTGCDRIKARYLHENPFEFQATHKIFMAANHKPEISGTDYAIWRRVKMIPFTETITEKEKDPHLVQKMKEELPGILAWCIRGCIDWHQGGLNPPQAVIAATEEYRHDQDIVGQFIEDECIIENGRNGQSSVIYDRYKSWCITRNEKCLTNSGFGTELTRRGFAVHKGSKHNYRLGIDIRGESLDL